MDSMKSYRLRASAERTKWSANGLFDANNFRILREPEWSGIMTGMATRMNDSHAIGTTAGGGRRAAIAFSTLAAMVSGAVEALAVWRVRAIQRRRLMELDVRLLSDIGLSRADAVSEAEKPYWRP